MCEKRLMKRRWNDFIPTEPYVDYFHVGLCLPCSFGNNKYRNYALCEIVTTKKLIKCYFAYGHSFLKQKYDFFIENDLIYTCAHFGNSVMYIVKHYCSIHPFGACMPSSSLSSICCTDLSLFYSYRSLAYTHKTTYISACRDSRIKSLTIINTSSEHPSCISQIKMCF